MSPPALASEAEEEIAAGAAGLELSLSGSSHPLATSLSLDAAEAALATLALPQALHLRIEAPGPSLDLARRLARLARRQGLDIALTFDPIAAMAARDPSARDSEWRGGLHRLAEACDGAVAAADGSLWHAAGASEVQELAAVLATYVALLRALGPLPVEDAMRRVGVTLAADSDQLLTTAKFRAMRLQLMRVAEVSGVASPWLHIHAETAWRMMSRREPRANILRATGAAFAAAVGGADSITVLPHDALDPLPDGAGRRLARNTQLILAEEAHVGRFADPSAGSGAVETLTDALAEAAWTRFQQIEAEGGGPEAPGFRTLIGDVAATRAARIERLRTGGTRMVGVNAFTDAGTGGKQSAISPDLLPTNRLAFRRLAEHVEAAP